MSGQTMPAASFAIDISSLQRLALLGTTSQSALLGQFLKAKPFYDPARYRLFLHARHRIAHAATRLYRHPLREALLPRFDDLGDIAWIERDMADLGVEPSKAYDDELVSVDPLDIATLLGALFVTEGLRLMVPYVRRQAVALGLHEGRGAGHLGHDPFAIRVRWNSFATQVNGQMFMSSEMRRMAAAADEAMRGFQAIIREEMPTDGRWQCLPGHKLNRDTEAVN